MLMKRNRIAFYMVTLRNLAEHLHRCGKQDTQNFTQIGKYFKISQIMYIKNTNADTYRLIEQA